MIMQDYNYGVNKNINNFIVSYYIWVNMLDKYNSQSTIINDDPIFNMESNDLGLDSKYGTLKRTRRRAKNVGVNTSRLAFNNSFELIQPITHLEFAHKKPNIIKYYNDGLDEQATVPLPITGVTPIHASEPKAAKTRIQHKLNRSVSRKFQTSHHQVVLNPEKLQHFKATTKMRRMDKIVNSNLKHVEANENLVKQSTRISYPQKSEHEDKPIGKKSFRFSNAGTRLSQSKLISKEQIISDAKKMIQQNCKQLTNKISNCMQQSLVKSNHIEILHNSKTKLQRSKAIPPEISSSNALNINLKTPTSVIKRILIESQEQLDLNFVIPRQLFIFPSFNTSTAELKERMTTIFGQLGIQIQLITIKKHIDRIQLRNKNMCIIWNFDGKGYFGEWRGQQILADLNKHGLGFQWSNQDEGDSLYYGQFRDNKKQGYGVMKEKSQIYVGCWKDNKRSGWGKLYQDHQLIKNGEFSQN